MLTPDQLQSMRQGLGVTGGPSSPTDQANTWDHFDSFATDQYHLQPDKAQEPGLISRIGTDLKGRAADVGKSVAQAASPESQNPLKTGVQVGGALVGAGTDVVGELGKQALSGVEGPFKGTIDSHVQDFIAQHKDTPMGQAVTGALAQLHALAEQHPTLKGAVNILLGLPLLAQGSEAAAGLKPALESVGADLADTAKAAVAAPGKAFNDLKGVIGSPASKADPVAALAKQFQPLEETAGKGKAAADAVAQGRGATEGSGLFEKPVITPDKQIQRAAESLKGVVQPDAPAWQQVNQLRDHIEQVATKEVRPLLQKDLSPASVENVKSIAKTPSLSKRLTSLTKTSPIDFTSAGSSQGTYKKVVDVMKDALKGQPVTKEGIWDARIAFDKAVEKRFPTIFDFGGPATPLRQAVKAVRDSVNNYLVETTSLNPEDAGKFKELMQHLSDSYTVRDNLAEKAAKELGTTKFMKLIKAHPIATKAVKTAANAAGLGEAINIFK